MSRRPPLRLGRRTFDDDRTLVMAIVNRTPDSFYDQGATYAFEDFLRRAEVLVA
jgi:dihydropteroate synthase